MKKVYYFILFLLIVIVFSRYSYLRFFKYDYYQNEYVKLNQKYVYGNVAPRGRILDRNGKLLVDNVSVNSIYYRDLGEISKDDVAIYLSNILEQKEKASDMELKKYYMERNDTNFLLSDEELEDFSYRRLSVKEVEELKLSRMDDIIKTYSDEDGYVIHLYSILNKGYAYAKKEIISDISSKECALVNELNIDGLECDDGIKRVYLYDTMNALYGSVGNISLENKEYYLSKGYALDDQVGLSYLEKEYDDYLRGEKAVYIVNDDKSLTKIKDSVKGNDIYLSIDIDLQLKINDVIKKYLDKKDKYRNTDYYNTSYVIVSNPNTGEILASSGISNVKDEYYDVTSNILTSSFTVGSIIKGASMTVGYQNNLVDIGKKINDSCVKLYQVPTKCSFKRLGYLDDISALKWSSNYYQFMLAIKLVGKKYRFDMKLGASEENFNTYRDTFKSFGLGTSTGIDLKNESYGITGKNYADDLYLNLSIGQYDTYTALQLINYINTIATSGKRYSLHYLSKVMSGDEVIYNYEPVILNEVSSNFERIHKGFYEVMNHGTGSGYTDLKYKPAGKTGTSEVVYSKDVTTINQTYAMFAPYDNPKYSIVVISPNVSYNNDKNNYIAPINRLISKEVSDIVLDPIYVEN